VDNRLAPKSINVLQQASMARAGPNTPAWWSDTNASWDPETGLDIYGNYGGPMGTSGPMGGWGGNPRIDAQNIANGWTQPSTGPTLQQPPAGSYASGTSGGAPQGYASPSYAQGSFDNFMPNAAAQGYNNPRGSMSTYAPSQRLSPYFGKNNSFTPNYGANRNSRF
jgi:hypothetical protein